MLESENDSTTVSLMTFPSDAFLHQQFEEKIVDWAICGIVADNSSVPFEHT